MRYVKNNTRDEDSWESLLTIGSPSPGCGGLLAEGLTTRSSITKLEESGSRLIMHGLGWLSLLAVFRDHCPTSHRFSLSIDFVFVSVTIRRTISKVARAFGSLLFDPVAFSIHCESYQRTEFTIEFCGTSVASPSQLEQVSVSPSHLQPRVRGMHKGCPPDN